MVSPRTTHGGSYGVGWVPSSQQRLPRGFKFGVDGPIRLLGDLAVWVSRHKQGRPRKASEAN
jgi:hypothetical protein